MLQSENSEDQVTETPPEIHLSDDTFLQVLVQQVLNVSQYKTKLPWSLELLLYRPFNLEMN